MVKQKTINALLRWMKITITIILVLLTTNIKNGNFEHGNLIAPTLQDGILMSIIVHQYPTDYVSVFNKVQSSKQNQNKLFQNIPNPFGTKTIIPFDLDEAKYVQLIIMDKMGRVVEEIKGDFNEGYNELILERSFNPGVYFYQISAEGFTETKKMILLE